VLPLFIVAMSVRALSGLFRRFYHDDDPIETRGWQLPGSTTRGGRTASLSHDQSRSFEGRVYRLAYKLGGRLTISDIIIETGLDTATCERQVNELVDETRVRMVVDDRGFVVYEFPEIIDRLERER
jgi:hypothetical protein